MLLSEGQEYAVHLGDCIEHMHAMPPAAVDFSLFSPPFPSVYSYTSEACDLGNADDFKGEVPLHFSFFFRALARVLKPGRVCILHCTDIVRMKRSGGQGLFDFPGLLVRLGERAGLIHEYRWTVRKNPQALRNGSRVLTPTGWTPIESLSVSSQVIGSTGDPVNVVGVHPQGIRPLFRVKTSDGASIDCDGRHLWTVRTTRGMVISSIATEVMARHGLFMPSGEPRFFLPLMEKPAAFTGKQLPLDPYLFGVLLGDGMLSSRGTVGVCTQRGIVESLQLPSGHSLRLLPESEKGNDVASWNILGNAWHQNEVLVGIRSLDLEGCRAWEKFIPDEYLFADEQSRRQLLAGLIDTDGGNKRTGGIKYHTTSLRLAEGFRFLVESLGGLCTLIRRTGGVYTHKGEKKTGRDIYELTPRLRDGQCPFRYPQKVKQWETKRPVKGMRRAIVSIESIGDHPCTCITVDAQDGLFVTESCIVTHNSQAIRGKAWELKFQGVETDRAMSRGALPDYLLKFRAPGENAVPIHGDGQVSRAEWIEWAEHCWADVKETDTLNVRPTKQEGDTRHICPLQLEVIRRLILLYSNPGEIVFSPFAGIGSEGYIAIGGKCRSKPYRRIKGPRRFYGCEIRPDWQQAALGNMADAVRQREVDEKTLFDALETAQ
jgi:hypothetical protein